jgi:hypothetical protein
MVESWRSFLKEMGRDFGFRAMNHCYWQCQYAMTMNISMDYHVSLNENWHMSQKFRNTDPLKSRELWIRMEGSHIWSGIVPDGSQIAESAFRDLWLISWFPVSKTWQYMEIFSHMRPFRECLINSGIAELFPKMHAIPGIGGVCASRGPIRRYAPILELVDDIENVDLVGRRTDIETWGNRGYFDHRGYPFVVPEKGLFDGYLIQVFQVYHLWGAWRFLLPKRYRSLEPIPCIDRGFRKVDRVPPHQSC